MSKSKYNINDLKKMRKTQLYVLAKNINSMVPYSKSTKNHLIDIIINNKTEINNIKPNNVNDTNYTPEYIENLLNQIEYFKKDSEMWRNKYINLLSNNNFQYNNINNSNINNINNNNNSNIQTKIECIQTKTDYKKTENRNNIEVKKKKSLWDKIDKPINDKRPMNIKIKENSLIDFINTMTRKDIEDMGFKSREEYYNNQLSLKKNKINIKSIKLKSINK